MAKFAIKPNPRVFEIFDELDKLREFCADYGYRFNEADLNNFKSYAWQQYSKFSQGKNAKNMWDEDTRRLANRY
jgi:dihydroorotase